MARRVRIEGDPEVYEVLCETDSTVLLTKPAARRRREIQVLERQLHDAYVRLAQSRGTDEVSP